MVSWSSLGVEKRCDDEAGLGVLDSLKGKCNATAYKDILYNCVVKH